jgi:hypothetical protein
MSHTNTYIVSTYGDGNMKKKIALVQSGNSRAAIKKFLLHVYPELLHCKMTKLPKPNGVIKPISTYLITDGEEHLFSIHAEKINTTSDFIPITDC